MNTPRHIVRRQVLDCLVLGDESDGHALHARLASGLSEALSRALDEVFTRVVPACVHWQAERIEVDLGTLSLEDVDRELVRRAAAAVEAVLERCAGELQVGVASSDRKETRVATEHTGRAGMQALVASREVRARTELERACEAFVHFLRTGTLPWWFRLAPGQSLERALVSASAGGALWSELHAALLVALESEPARTRLVRQFSAPFVDAAIASLSIGASRIAIEVTRDLKREPRLDAAERCVSLAVLALIASQQTVTRESLIQGTVQHVARELKDPRERGAMARSLRAMLESASSWQEPFTDVQTPPSASAPEVFVDCAGLVLVHPFLPTLFERLHVAEGDVLHDVDRGLALLHFLATGETPAPEHALSLAKLLCGRELSEPAGVPVSLSEHEMAEANAMLTAVVSHWEALGGASVDALRGTFLTRNGKLTPHEGGHLLQVETQAFDVLIDRLPWGLGVLRLPWMASMLWVEWCV